MTAPTDNTSGNNNIGVIGGGIAIALALVGVVLSFSRVSLTTGDGMIWASAALGVASFVVALAVPRVKLAPTFVTLAVAAFLVINAFYVDQQLDKKSDRLQQDLQQVQIPQVQVPPQDDSTDDPKACVPGADEWSWCR